MLFSCTRSKLASCFRNMVLTIDRSLVVECRRSDVFSEILSDEKIKRLAFSSWLKAFRRLIDQRNRKIKTIEALVPVLQRQVSRVFCDLIYEPIRIKAMNPMSLTHLAFKRLVNSMGFVLPTPMPGKRVSIPTLLLSPQLRRSNADSNQHHSSILKPPSTNLPPSFFLTPMTPRALQNQLPSLRLLRSFYSFLLSRSTSNHTGCQIYNTSLHRLIHYKLRGTNLARKLDRLWLQKHRKAKVSSLSLLTVHNLIARTRESTTQYTSI